MTRSELLGVIRELRVGLLLLGADDEIHLANPAALRLLGFTETEVTVAAFLNAELIQEDGTPLPPERHPILGARATREPVHNVVVGVDRPGSNHRVWLRVDVEPQIDGDGQIRQMTCTLIEITDRRGMEAALEESERLLSITLTSIHEGLVVYDRELRCVEWNRQMELLFGIPAGKVLGRKALDLLPHLQDQGIDRLLENALAGEAVRLNDIRYVDAQTGQTRWYAGSYGPHRTANGDIVGVVGHVHDITDRKRMEERLLHDALHDALTGLPNRALLLERLGRALERSRRHSESLFAVLFLDLDRFKVVNDSLGHTVGDRLLVEIARRVQECVRSSDTVARLGGDEFALLLDDLTGVGEATRTASRILAALGAPFHVGGQRIFTSASIGIALRALGDGQAEDLLRDADTAMYRAKAQGRGRYQVFDSSMHEEAAGLMRLETDLRRGIEQQQFLVVYQPIVSLSTGRIEGFEALLRWRHPDRGLVSPGSFVPLAEETGLIVPLGRFVLREATRQLEAWREGLPEHASLGMNVNVSGKEFSQEDLVEAIAAALRDTRLPAGALRLEITESSIVEDTSRASETVGKLKDLGVQLHIDDFGVGYSSLSSLHRFPIDALKVDRSFVGRMGVTAEGGEIVQTVILLAQNLGMAVIAEGVETAVQLAKLRHLGCGHAQGFLFSPPLGAEQAGELLVSDRRW